MQTSFVKFSVFIVLCMAVNATVAQQKNVKHKTYSTGYTTGTGANGKTTERISTVVDNTAYKIEMEDEKITSLYVDGKLIPPEQYSQYEAVISKIKEQMRLDKIQAKKDQEQAVKDQQQAKLDQEQAVKDQQQAKLDQEHAIKDQASAKLDMERAKEDQQKAKADQEQAGKDQQRAKLDQEQANEARANAKIDMQRADKDQQKAKLDQEQAGKDQAQARLDQEHAMKDQARAKIDQQQAEEDQRLVKQMITDLIKDGIVTNEKSLLSITIDSEGMTVNDKKQPDEVYKKYKEKYNRFATGNFNYSNSPGDNKGIRMHRPSR